MSTDQEATGTQSKKGKRGGSRVCTGIAGDRGQKVGLLEDKVLYSLLLGYFGGGGMRKGRLPAPKRGHEDFNHPTTNPFTVPLKSGGAACRVGEISSLGSDQGHTGVKT